MIKNLSQYEIVNFDEINSQNLLHIFFFEESLITIISKSETSGDILRIKQFSYFSHDFHHFADVFITIIKSCQLTNCPFDNLRFYNISSKYLISKKMNFPQPESFYRNELSIFFSCEDADSYILTTDLYNDMIINSVEKKLILETVNHFYPQAKITSYLSRIIDYLRQAQLNTAIQIIFFYKTAHIVFFKDKSVVYFNAFESNDYINLAYHILAISQSFSINIDEAPLFIYGNYDFLSQFIQVLKEDIKTIVLDDAHTNNQTDPQQQLNSENSLKQFSAYTKFL